MKWETLQIINAVASHGSLRRASEILGISHSTASRQLRAFEKSLGTQIFERTTKGFILTQAGEDLVATSLHVEDLIKDVERKLQGYDEKLEGSISVTMPEALYPLIIKDIKEFCAIYPEIEISLSTSTAFVNLLRREADVAIRFTNTPDLELVGRSVGKVRVAIYGAKNYLKSRSLGSQSLTSQSLTPQSLDQHHWIDWEDQNTVFSQWLKAHVPEAKIACKVTNSWMFRDAIEQGFGLAVVPCLTGDREPNWERLEIIQDIQPDLWVLSHKDLRTTARVKKFREYIYKVLLDKKSLIEASETN
ncbi:LysR family transcriptional regulator [Litoribrevibacter albus]|uniref:LysR family transcriptional regulator n=1 Tax=Litoribrevibacter albus TaxID=1473156 RepID=A0AA37S918_9GAMM|nr:LysR family transcriptional regulator [Litoribrevibacter albus]GLQ30423.1 LysR family transcriptional regulator [Litoribrevibacter albus]